MSAGRRQWRGSDGAYRGCTAVVCRGRAPRLAQDVRRGRGGGGPAFRLPADFGGRARFAGPSDAFGCIVTGLLSRGRLCILASDARVARAMTPRQKRSRAEENMMLWRDDAVSGRRSDLAFNTCRDRAATASLGSL